ncbi:MAG TPA: hypothetical protein VGM90_23135 [Kofleriaceae bacterium]|jgi:hypothetical protein
MDSKPHVFARGTRESVKMVEPTRVVVFAPTESLTKWIDAELVATGNLVQSARSMSAVVSSLVDDPTPRPQVLVLDVDGTQPGDLMYLHLVRERGWCGRIIGLGMVPPALRLSLGIERVLNTPYAQGTLRHAIDDIGFSNTTRRIPTFDDDEVACAALPVMPVFLARSNARVQKR